MLNKVLILLLVSLASSAIFAVAWPGPATSTAQSDSSSFLPQSIPLAPAIVGDNPNALSILDKALDQLAPERTRWLKTKVRQTMNDGKIAFSAEGFLQRGPECCARLELDILANGLPAKLLLVSDGRLLAEVRTLPNRPPIEQVVHLLPENDQPAVPIDLNAKGCGGPVALLEQIRQRLTNAQVQTGMLGGNPVIEIKGDLNVEKLPAFSNVASRVRTACVYLDAGTLWPARFEWWGTHKDRTIRRILQIEFPDPELNRQLSVAECERLFSYRPQGNVGAVELE